MALRHSDLILVKQIKGKGRGVFARRPIPEAAVIETVPLIVVPLRDLVANQDPSQLTKFCFMRGRFAAAIALGYGSLYNHSYAPNACYREGPAASMVFRALRAIATGEEITINYNGDPEDKSPVVFEVH
jgi:SET domain-containing protein